MILAIRFPVGAGNDGGIVGPGPTSLRHLKTRFGVRFLDCARNDRGFIHKHPPSLPRWVCRTFSPLRPEMLQTPVCKVASAAVGRVEGRFCARPIARSRVKPGMRKAGRKDGGRCPIRSGMTVSGPGMTVACQGPTAISPRPSSRTPASGSSGRRIRGGRRRGGGYGRCRRTGSG